MTAILETDLGFIDATTLAGYCRDHQDPARRFIVEVLADGTSVAVLRADEFCPKLAVPSDAAANYGFTFALSAAMLDGSETIEVRVANTAIAVGRPIELSNRQTVAKGLGSAGEVKALGGLKLGGWARLQGSEPVAIRFFCEGEEIASTICRRWITIAAAGELQSMPAFEVELPSILADGHRHRILVFNSSGVPLAGNPVFIEAINSPTAD